MTETKQYYKVVDRYQERYFSAFASGSLRIEYKLNEWSEASVGGLLVFDNLQAAVDFKTGRPYYDIFKCEVAEAVDLSKYRADSVQAFTQINIISKFWQNLSYEILESEILKLNMFLFAYYSGVSQWPEHTVAFKRVKLTELIEPPYDWPTYDLK